MPVINWKGFSPVVQVSRVWLSIAIFMRRCWWIGETNFQAFDTSHRAEQLIDDSQPTLTTQNLSNKRFSELFTRLDSTRLDDIYSVANGAKRNMNWFFIYMCQPLAADLFWSCFDMLIEWRLWHFTIHRGARTFARRRRYSRESSLETAYRRIRVLSNESLADDSADISSPYAAVVCAIVIRLPIQIRIRIDLFLLIM